MVAWIVNKESCNISKARYGPQESGTQVAGLPKAEHIVGADQGNNGTGGVFLGLSDTVVEGRCGQFDKMFETT